MDRRFVLAGTVLIAALLPVGLLGFDLYYHPYEPDPPRYGVAHESTAAFEDAVDRANLDPDAAAAVADLSPEARSAFDAASAQPVESDRRPSGWQRLEVTVCHERMLVCDEFASPPAFPVHGESHDDSTVTSLYAIVEADDGLYVVTTQYEFGTNVLHQISGLLTLLAFLVFSALLAWTGYAYTDSRRASVLGGAGVGLVLFSWPYLVVVTGVGTRPWALIPLTGGGILFVCAHLERVEGVT